MFASSGFVLKTGFRLIAASVFGVAFLFAFSCYGDDDQAEGKPAQSASEKPIEKSGEKPADSSSDKPAEKQVEKSSEKEAEKSGVEDLDKATQKKLQEPTLSNLSEVIRLCESAISKGLDDESKKFAELMLASALTQRASVVAGTITGPAAQAGDQWKQTRKYAVADLQRALKLQPKQTQGLYLLARLEFLPDGDAKLAAESLDKALQSFDGGEDEIGLKVKLLLLRANTKTKPEERLADLNEAAKLAPGAAEIYLSRGLAYVAMDKLDQAATDLSKVVELAPNNISTYEALWTILAKQKKYDEALKVIEKAQKIQPKSVALLFYKSKIHTVLKQYDAAIDDLTKAYDLDVGNPTILLLRAATWQEKGDATKALEDIDQLLTLRPNHPDALRFRAGLMAAQGKSDAAAEELKKILADNPKDLQAALQLSAVYTLMKRGDLAVEPITKALKEAPDEPALLRSRGDAYLNIGKQAEALADYEKVYAKVPDDTGLLNNFAWVLSTSPDAKLRDGKRALEMALKAATSTERKQAHIMSTLAAAYAETGDFESAKKCAKEAVALPGQAAEKSELETELKSYEAKKPWRELLINGEAAKIDEATGEVKGTGTQAAPDKQGAAASGSNPIVYTARFGVEPIEPFNGKTLDGWKFQGDKTKSHWRVGAAKWNAEKPKELSFASAEGKPGELVNVPGGGIDILTERNFDDCVIELEFMIPKDANAGVYVMGEYEVRIADSFGKKDALTSEDSGAIYGVSAPKLNAAKGPGEWQSLRIEFRAPRFQDGQKIADAKFLKVVLNDQTVQENVTVSGPTKNAPIEKEGATGPLAIQGSRDSISIRNVKVTPLR